jgi:hypothetical protein
MSNLTVRNGFLPTTFSEAKTFAGELAASNLVPKAYAGKPLDILVAIQWGNEIGLAPMQALQNISVINGKPSVYGDAAMALVQAHPACEGVEEFFEGEGTPNPVAVCIAHRRGRKPVTAKFSVDDAVRAGLWKKPGPWTQYPKRMLQMRARGFALRDAFPDALKGLITTEEAEDYPAEAKQEPKDITPKNPLDAIALPEVIEPAYQEAAVEVVDGTVTVEAEVVEVVAEPEEAETSGGGWLLYTPRKDPQELSSLEEWLKEYNALADKTAGAGRAAPRARMTALRELREANDPTIKRAPTLVKVVLTQGHQTRLAWLGHQMREEEGKSDNVKEDHGPQRQT